MLNMVENLPSVSSPLKSVRWLQYFVHLFVHEHSFFIAPHFPSSFPTYRTHAILLLQFFFVCASMDSYMSFVLSLYDYVFLVSPSFGASEGLCRVSVVFSGYLHLFYCKQ